ncbi:MAG: sugar-binding domain-containing protein [Actinomycetota bacterium]|nr:sugar-binding domain-containing protein [Actinomycetota bacterium]
MKKTANTKEIIDLSGNVELAVLGISDIGRDSTLLKSGNFVQEEFDYLKNLGVIGDVNLIFINSKGEHVNNILDERLIRVSLNRVKRLKML